MNAPSKPASIRYSGQWRRKQVRELSSRRCGAAVEVAVTTGAGVVSVPLEEMRFGCVLSINTYFAETRRPQEPFENPQGRIPDTFNRMRYSLLPIPFGNLPQGYSIWSRKCLNWLPRRKTARKNDDCGCVA